MLRRILAVSFFMCMMCCGGAQASQFSERPSVQQFIQDMVEKYQFSRQELEQIFAEVKPNAKVLKLIAKPAEKKPWYFYQQLFVSDKHVRQGTAFWNQHTRVLNEAQQIYGVPASVIVAIIGIETNYGENRGEFSTLDALSTLAFDYPRRAAFFRGELVQLFLLSRELGVDPIVFRGSYAGAIGYPQFMPSSYRQYAVDFNGNKQADLLNDPVDAMGSVGNYLHQKGWQPHQPIAVRAKMKGSQYAQLEDKAAKIKTIKQFAQYGVYPVVPFPADKRAGLLRLDGEHGSEYWLVFRNFYVIKAYNSSALYAMAVFQLSNLLEQRRRS